MTAYNSGAFTKMYDWDTNGSTSSPKWMIAGGAYPNYNTTTTGGSNIACYFSTNFTTWSRKSVPRDDTYGGTTINQFISAEYVRRFSNNEDFDLFKMSMNIIKGYNKNEVKFIGKTRKNKGFFEKFFDFFS